MARRLKAVNPEIITCMGGPACEGVMGRTYAAQVDAIDYVFSGPALVGFPDFVESVMSGRLAGCDRINGVFTADPPAANAPVLGDDLDINTNIKLDYTEFLDAFDRTFPDCEKRPALLFETSRGCYWAEKMVCTFCGLNGLQRHYRQMTPENGLEQIESLQQWVPRCASFIAVDTAMPRDYVTALFPALDLPAGMKLMYEVRPDLTGDELGAMCKAGVAALQPGIEALSSSTLKLMRKGVTAFGNIRFLKACSRHPLALDSTATTCNYQEI